MKSIWKFELPIRPGTVEILMPAGAKVLHVDEQHGAPVLWALVDLDAQKETRKFVTRWTGFSIDGSPGGYIGTVKMYSGDVIAHIFEVV